MVLRNRARRDELDNLPRRRGGVAAPSLQENFLSESEALISWQGIRRVARSIAGWAERTSGNSSRGIGRKRGTLHRSQPHTRGGWRAIPHALSRHSMGRGRKKEQDRGQKLLPDSVMHVRSASLRHGHARLGECTTCSMW